MSGNQILVKSASNIDSRIISFQFINKKKSYLLLLNPVLGASVAMNNRFSKFTCNNWFRNWVLTRFVFENYLSTHAVLRGTINIRWSSFKQLGKIITQALSFEHVEYNLCTSKEVSEAQKVSLSFLLLQFISFLWNFSSLALRFSNILTKPQPIFNCSYTINIPNLAYSNRFTCACIFFTIVIN